MSYAVSTPSGGFHVFFGATTFVALHSSSTALLDRTLRQHRASSGFGALLRDEVIAYQLVWPD